MSSLLKTPELPPIGFAASLSDDDRLLLSSYGDFKAFQAEQIIIKQGAPQDSIYLILGGILHVKRLHDKTNVLLYRMTTGDSFGEISFFDPGPASATVLAKDFSQVWNINHHHLKQFMETSPVATAHLLSGIAGQLARRLRASNQRLAEETKLTKWKNLLWE